MSRCKDRRISIEHIICNTCDISEWLDFELYDLYWFWDTTDDWDNPKLGRWLRVSQKIGSSMYYWILPSNATVIARKIIQHVTRDAARDDIAKEDIMDGIKKIHFNIDKILGDNQYVSTK